MKQTKDISKIMDIIKYPVITDKTTKKIEDNIYCFAVDYKSNKHQIKQIIEYTFNVKIAKINTINLPLKMRKVGKFKGPITKYKKAIIKLQENYTINLFDEN
uniref:Large ribosomal subunit protein uL23c n=1 Tax=Bostrychia moritziana TaxID=103713 RepID=A0A1Z1M786_BOSMO|nr:ribosomal protein L23 [Bostrychia moritziana]ARW61701.1 ribosomal protein L23 [Bostrychia moritziana]